MDVVHEEIVLVGESELVARIVHCVGINTVGTLIFSTFSFDFPDFLPTAHPSGPAYSAFPVPFSNLLRQQRAVHAIAIALVLILPERVGSKAKAGRVLRIQFQTVRGSIFKFLLFSCPSPILSYLFPHQSR